MIGMKKALVLPLSLLLHGGGHPMNASLKRLLTGTALVGMLGLVLGGPLTRPVPTGAAPRLWPDPCNLAFPNRQPLRVIAVSAGVGHVITLQGGGYTFAAAA